MTHRAGFRVMFLMFLSFGLSGCMAPTESATGTVAHVRCSAPSGVSGNPQSIYEAMTLINALPKPLTVGCFIESLDRPLRIQATAGQASTQPADGARSPRIFIFRGNLVMSVVPSGMGVKNIELSEFASYGISVRGGVTFPVLAALPTSTPYTSIRSGGGTRCSSCHGGEVHMNDDSTHTQAYVSNVILPDASLEVSIPKIIAYSNSCNWNVEPERCGILSAVVGETADLYRGDF